VPAPAVGGTRAMGGGAGIQGGCHVRAGRAARARSLLLRGCCWLCVRVMVGAGAGLQMGIEGRISGMQFWGGGAGVQSASCLVMRCGGFALATVGFTLGSLSCGTQ
jgi:hypothetical protein